MIKHHEIDNIVKTRFEKINIGLESIRLHFHEDDIRVFRVKVKKLAACIQLINAARGQQHKAIKIPPRLLKYFEVAGIVRNLQLQKLYVETTLDARQAMRAGAYLNLVSNKILHHMVVASQIMKGVQPFKRAEINLLKLLPDHLSSKSAAQFVRSEIKKLEKLLMPVFPSDDSLHEIRKLLKGLLYVWPHIGDKVAQTSPYGLLSGKENIAAFTEVLGKFHDMDTAIGLLHDCCLNRDTEESEKEILRTLERLWIKEKETIRLQVYQQLQQIISSRQPVQPLIQYAMI
ncbi:CHAD domain-containing protein [Mucilaginibacter paludis]|uniref:CHAD domain-containing protein n=1 Tax=Mucilaginibacter paludis DSM 18603 TaxID=714943 RepID=H1Y8D7_9SPHI|nr:CHAD domain-containing protein [Mucilaginibacter paludis]EHQ24956.1 hypothetical protein Mucpa_0775 [Mucilaginibacter paludis DSM 18603]